MVALTRKSKSGFTLPELLIIIGLFSALFALSAINLLVVQRHASLNAAVDSLVSDLRQQQLKAMVGDRENRTTPDNYGIHFESGSYTLFHGLAYSPGAQGNYVVSLDSQLQFSGVTWPGSLVVFLRSSGEVSGYTQGRNTVVLRNISDSTSKTIIINRYGVITSIN